MAEFKPSTPNPQVKPRARPQEDTAQTLAALRYMRRAARALEAEIEAGRTLSPWVVEKIQQAAILVGMAMNYTSKKINKADAVATKVRSAVAKGRKNKG